MCFLYDPNAKGKYQSHVLAGDASILIERRSVPGVWQN